MKERILFAPGIHAGEMLNSLALHGVNSIGLRSFGSGELARYALMHAGVPIEKEFVSVREEAAIVSEAVKTVPYFEKATYADVQELTTCIRKLRYLVADENEQRILEQTLPQGIFKEKNHAILQVFRKYMEILTSLNATDTVSLLRKAIAESKGIQGDFLMLKGFPFSPLERKLAEVVSGGKITEISLEELFGVSEKPIQISSFRNCYGAPNEAEMILSEIYSGKSLDQCTVAVTDTGTYGQLFFDLVLLYDIPVSFGCGIPVTNSSPAKLLALYERWCTSGFFGADALNEMLVSDAFDAEKFWKEFPETAEEQDFSMKDFRTLLGNLRLTNDREMNEKRIADLISSLDEKDEQGKRRYIPWMEAAGRELALPVEEFVKKYARLRKGNKNNAESLLMTLDLAAHSAIYEELKVMRKSGFDMTSEDVIPNVLRMNVCRQRSEEGKLHVTGISGAFSTLRPNLYIAGLSASKFPGTPKENYLLLDADLDLFGDASDALKADGIILRKNEQLMSLVRLASALDVSISVSFAGLNVAELKKDNPSSLVYRLCQEENGADTSIEEIESRIEKIGYFEPAVSRSRLVGEAYTKGQQILQDDSVIGETIHSDTSPNRAYSPSALEIFFACPRRFYLKYIMSIPEPEETDPFEIISAADIGTLSHSLLEEIGGAQISLEDFISLSGTYFDRFLKEHPALVPENVPAVKDQFIEMMVTAYEMDPNREVLLKEEDVQCTHESGVELHGYPDRVERLEDGSCLIVDFKSKRRIDHVQDDIDTCLQVVIYAYLMEQKGLKVSGAEYRYIRLGETVSCQYNEEIKQKLSEKLEYFRECMENGEFPLAEQPVESDSGNDPCRYCKYGEICGKQIEEDGD